MTNKDKKNIHLDENIETEYIGAEETDYIEIDEEGETEYIDVKTGKIPGNVILNERYKVIATIGKGGMGAVYKALDMRLREIAVAIKEISLETIADERIEKVIQNFENEAATLISLRHNAIPRVMDFFSLNNNKCYIVMDLIDGETLDQVIRKRGKIPESEVREWIYQLADVLKYLHSRDPKVIFRDLKPSNVMITKDNQIKLIDFGIARTFKDDKSTDTTYYVSQGFSPPEQYGTGQSDERSDIYSLGALAYSLLIGGKPKIKNFKFEDLRDFTEVSDQLNEAIIKATDFRPENRPSSIDEFLNLCDSKYKRQEHKSKGIHRKIPFMMGMLLVLLIGGYAIHNKSGNGKVEKLKNEDIKTMQEQSNDKEKNKEPNIDVKNAMRKLYEATGDDKNTVIYELNNDQSYIGDKKTKRDFYIFNICSIGGATSDYNLAVRKKDNKVFYGSTYGIIIPYEDYINENSVISKYLKDYESSAPNNEDMIKNSKAYLEANGAEALYEKVKAILSNGDIATIEFYTGPLGYVEQILSGSTKKELDDYTNKRMYPDQDINETDTSISDDYQTPDYVKLYKDKKPTMEELYKEGESYDFDEGMIDSLYYEGKTAGYNFALANNNPTTKEINEYIDINSPENAASLFWTNGFFEGYNSVG